MRSGPPRRKKPHHPALTSLPCSHLSPRLQHDPTRDPSIAHNDTIPHTNSPEDATDNHHRRTQERRRTTTMAENHYKFNITMTCGGCSGAVERVLKKLDGSLLISSSLLPPPSLSPPPLSAFPSHPFPYLCLCLCLSYRPFGLGAKNVCGYSTRDAQPTLTEKRET